MNPYEKATSMARSFSFTVAALFFFLFHLSNKAHGLKANFSVLLLNDLAPQHNCSPSKAPEARSLRIIHRWGPCSPLNGSKPNVNEILAKDFLRVSSLHARLTANVPENKTAIDLNGVSVPASSSAVLGDLSFVVTIGLGTPAVDQTVIFDTGSDVCWVQCLPCNPCYSQKDRIFNPSASSSYSRFSCSSRACTDLDLRGCSSGSCVYVVRYGDGSNTTGFLSSEKLTLSTENSFQGFVFGCGVVNYDFQGVAGLIGLGRGAYSLTSQTTSSLGSVFSYCLPLQSSSTGWLTLGRSSAYATAYYTPMLTNSLAPSFYYIDLIGISVAGVRLPVPADVFRAVGTIIDSGTTFSYLPPAVYTELRAAFQSAMAGYNRIAGVLGLDTCYSFRNAGQVQYPQLVLHFTDVDVTLGTPGVLFQISDSEYCLPFVATEGTSIIGNVQQKGLEVVYDIGGKRIGFAGGTCG